MNRREEASALLSLCGGMINATAGISVPEMHHCFSRLAKKLLFHGMSTLRISEGDHVQIAAGRVPIVDFASGFVLARASCETYITYALLDDAVEDPDLFEFRYCTWTLGDIRERQTFPTFGAEDVAKKASEAIELQSLLSRVKATAYYNGLSSKEKKSVRSGYNWHPGDSLSSLIAEQFGPDLGSVVYPFLCSFAHSGSISAAQVEEVKSLADQQDAMELVLLLTLKVVALTNARYAARFVQAATYLEGSSYADLNAAYAALLPLQPPND